MSELIDAVRAGPEGETAAVAAVKVIFAFLFDGCCESRSDRVV